MENFKSGFVSLIGETNVGKSTLLNAILGENIAITTARPQTTRRAIKGIVNRENSQIIFIDTPGIHRAKNKLGKAMIQTAYDTTADADVVLFLISAENEEIGDAESKIIEKIKEKNKKVILVINKIDCIKKERLLKIIEKYKNVYNFSAIVPISALRKEKIEALLDEIEEQLPIGPAYYSTDEYTDQTERQLVEEIVREKCLKLLKYEIPHGIYVKVNKMKLRKTKKDEEIYDIDITIYCTRESHKGIIIGKDGEMLKKIGQYSRQKIEAILGLKVNMRMWVKVDQNWQDKDNVIKNL